MQNLTDCGVIELNQAEMQDIDGGWVVIAIRVAAVVVAAGIALWPTSAN